jgi:hypothetical protein
MNMTMALRCFGTCEEDPMDIAVEDRFFTALNAVASARLGAHHPCAVAAANAARFPTHANVTKAHDSLARLDGNLREEIITELESWIQTEVPV